MKKQKKYLSAIQNGYVANPRRQYSLIISWEEDKIKKYEIHKVAGRELDIHKKCRDIFYRVAKEKSNIILHNIVKPYQQDLHNYKSKKGILEPKNNKVYERDEFGNIVYDTLETAFGNFTKAREIKIEYPKIKRERKEVVHIPIYNNFEYTYCIA